MPFAKTPLTEPPKRAADIAKSIVLRSAKQDKAEEHAPEPPEPSGAVKLPPLSAPATPTPAPQQIEQIGDLMRKMLANESGGQSS